MNAVRFAEAIRQRDINTLTNLLETSSGLIKEVYSEPIISSLKQSFWKEHCHDKTDCEFLEVLQKHGADIDEIYRSKYYNNNGWTPVIYAVDVQCLRCLRFLITKKADLNVETRFGKTALIYAVKKKAYPSVETLVELGPQALINEPDTSGKTALMWAVQEDESFFCKQLIKARADLNIEDKNGNTALIWAVKSQIKENIEALIPHCNPEIINHKDKQGRTALMWAAETADHSKADTSICKQLINAGADVNLKNMQGKTVLSIFIERKQKDVVPLLLQNASIVNTISNDGTTPLYHAFKQKYWIVIAQLFEEKADPTYSLKHTGFMHKSILNNKTARVRTLVMNGFPPTDYSFILDRNSLYKEIPRQSLSPLTLALWMNKPSTARYLIINRFFTPSDINQTKDQNEKLRQRLTDIGSSEGLRIFEFHLQTVQTLFTLSLVTISSALTQDLRADNAIRDVSSNQWRFKPTFKERVKILGLSIPLQEVLLHQTPSSEICCKEWEHISLEKKNDFKDCVDCHFCTAKVKIYESDLPESDDSEPHNLHVPEPSDSDDSEPHNPYVSELHNPNVLEPPESDDSEPHSLNVPEQPESNDSEPHNPNVLEPPESDDSEPHSLNVPEQPESDDSEPHNPNVPEPSESDDSEPHNLNVPEPSEPDDSELHNPYVSDSDSCSLPDTEDLSGSDE